MAGPSGPGEVSQAWGRSHRGASRRSVGTRPISIGRMMASETEDGRASSSVDLFWLPLGAGASIVRFNGRVYEAAVAHHQRREPCTLVHAALEVTVPGGRYAIELAPVPDADGPARGVVSEGAVGSRLLQGLRMFRYELRCWRDGVIPDLAEAIGGPRRLTAEGALARAVLDTAAATPRLVWGRDGSRTGEMWNSNSAISWLLVRSGVPLDAAGFPAGTRAPGWQAGVTVAHRQAIDAGPLEEHRDLPLTSGLDPHVT